MRGKGVQLNRRMVAARITPAYAGKSPHGHAKKLLSGDHPRLCGEK